MKNLFWKKEKISSIFLCVRNKETEIAVSFRSPPSRCGLVNFSAGQGCAVNLGSQAYDCYTHKHIGIEKRSWEISCFWSFTKLNTIQLLTACTDVAPLSSLEQRLGIKTQKSIEVFYLLMWNIPIRKKQSQCSLFNIWEDLFNSRHIWVANTQQHIVQLTLSSSLFLLAVVT